MTSLWSSLAPLIIGSALVPVQILITILLLQSSAGRRTAIAFVCGMTTVRLAQGAIFGLTFSSATATDSTTEGAGVAASVVLLIVAILFLVTGVRALLVEPDPDAPPPKWLTATKNMRPVIAFLLGAGILTIGIKFWVFTLGAIASIGEADLGQPNAAIAFVAFVVLAESIHLGLITVAFVAPKQSTTILDAFSERLDRYNRHIMVALGFVFGIWFGVKALDGLGVW